MSRTPYRRAAIDDFPRGRFPALREVLAGRYIGRACAREWAFHDYAATIREAHTPKAQIDTASKLAKRYALRGSLGHLVMVHTLMAAADYSGWVLRQELGVGLGAEVVWLDLGTSLAVIHCDPATRPDHRRYFPGGATVAALERGAELISRRGAGLCLWPGCDAERDEAISRGGLRDGVGRAGRKYCEAHFEHPPDEKKLHAKIIEQTFAAAAAALPRLGDQRRALALAA